MKAKVIKRFKDVHSGQTYDIGDVIEVSADRLKEIQTAGKFVEKIRERKPKEVKEEPKTEE